MRASVTVRPSPVGRPCELAPGSDVGKHNGGLGGAQQGLGNASLEHEHVGFYRSWRSSRALGRFQQGTIDHMVLTLAGGA
eukprot:10962788-Alexandrium_andersonii.AAC.1